MTGPRLLAVLGAALLAFPAVAAGDGRMIAIGDSIAAPDDSYVHRHAAVLGITDVVKIATGDTSGEVLTGIVPRVVAAIDDPSDTRVVSVAVGGHDYLRHLCANGWNRPDCAFADNLFAILTRLQTALAADPGDEPLLVLAYYNPASGRGTDLERSLDAGILGRDGRVDATEHGDDWGSADVVRFVSCRAGATMVNAHPAFKAGGPALMSDELHPNADGQAVLTDLFLDPSRGGPTGPCPATTPFATTLADAGDGRARGIVEPRLAAARWWFEYGTTTAYGSATAPATLDASAGPRDVTATLPAGAWHVRLVTENAVGRFAGADQTMRTVPGLGAWPAGAQSVRSLLARGAAVRVRSTTTTVAIVAQLVRPGPDLTLVRTVRTVPAGVTTTVRVRLGATATRIVRRAHHPQVVLTLTARGATGDSPPVRIVLR